MRYDVIVIGGGLSAIMCGIALATNGKNVALMVKGQSKLNFSSGSIDLLGFDEQGHEVESPLEAIAKLGPSHPYTKMGVTNVAHNARMTPMGLLRPAWLTLDDYVTSDNATSLPWRKVALANIHGFLDFPAEFIEAAVNRLGSECRMCDIKLGTVDKLSSNPTVMRSTAVAKLMQNDGVLNDLGVSWRFETQDYEEDTGLMHYTWRWEDWRG